MKFPNKVNSYKSSVLPLLPKILKLLSVKDHTVTRLYELLEKEMSINEYIDGLDCLFAIGKIKINKEVLHYVERDTI